MFAKGSIIRKCESMDFVACQHRLLPHINYTYIYQLYYRSQLHRHYSTTITTTTGVCAFFFTCNFKFQYLTFTYLHFITLYTSYVTLVNYILLQNLCPVNIKVHKRLYDSQIELERRWFLPLAPTGYWHSILSHPHWKVPKQFYALGGYQHGGVELPDYGMGRSWNNTI